MTPRLAAVLATAALCCSCSAASAMPAFTGPAPVSALIGAPPAVVPASSHVTGTERAHCTLTQPGPDPTCTPGTVRADVTQTTIRATICVAGWTATVRPPESETSRAKATAMRAYGITAPSGIVEEDHLVPIELGGSNDVTNLWPEVSDQPGKGFRNSKDTVENALRRDVCSGRVTLTAAQTAIATDWRTAIGRLGL